MTCRLVGLEKTIDVAAGPAWEISSMWLLMLLAGNMSGGTVTAGLLIGALIIFGCDETLLSPSLTALVNDLAPERLRGRCNAVFNLGWQIGPIVAPILSGSALASGLGGALFVALADICGAVSAPIADDLTFAIEPPKEPDVVDADQEALP
jgi:MFS family permease